ncbi:hypothetical protein RGQ30_07270 [Limnobacter thiooxidans]|uniref:Uncharacterized protein n=1 Tax=Limnobacter thiooxidans TaxID=131080 RepID=A0AA86MCS7_9BURK|nr:hypothetical protein RGQ30_07270 [Limnobacter thiooxidans]
MRASTEGQKQAARKLEMQGPAKPTVPVQPFNATQVKSDPQQRGQLNGRPFAGGALSRKPPVHNREAQQVQDKVCPTEVRELCQQGINKK